MYLILIFEILIVTALIGSIINAFCSKEVNVYVKGMALVSWLINFLLILFLPFDIYITYRDEKENTLSNDYLNLAQVKIYIYKIDLSNTILDKFYIVLDSDSHNARIRRIS